MQARCRVLESNVELVLQAYCKGEQSAIMLPSRTASAVLITTNMGEGGFSMA